MFEIVTAQEMALKLLYLSTCYFADLRAAKMVEDFPDDVAFEAANYFSFTFSLTGTLFDVGERRFMAAHTDDCDTE